MTLDISKPIQSLDDATQFIRDLIAADKLFHFEDSPETILDGNRPGHMLFTPDEAVAMRCRVFELYTQDWSQVGEECPIGYALTMSDPDWKAS